MDVTEIVGVEGEEEGLRWSYKPSPKLNHDVQNE